MQFSENAPAAPALGLAVLLALSAAGCRAPDPTAPAPEGPPSPGAEPAPVVEPPDPAELLALLEAAALALDRDHLIYPSEGSALFLYEAVLQRDPGNAEALRGIEQMVEHYLTEAELAAERRQFIKAGAMLDRARQVDAAHPALPAVATKVRLLEEARRERHHLDRALLSQRSEQLLPELRRIGRTARSNGCRAVLRARSDAEGRWLYQQMSGPPGDTRIQADIEIGSPPAVELICIGGGS